MQLLCVANWSEGRNEALLGEVRRKLHSSGAVVHFDGADEDHNRIVTAFSGEESCVERTLLSVAEVAFDVIDMRHHEGVHPRIGALDVCPFIVLKGELDEALSFAKRLGEQLASAYSLPVFLYEKSESGKHAADLPSLRKGQFEGLFGRRLNPDFGPNDANPRLGASVLGVRDWLLAMNVNLPNDKLAEARAIAGEMRVQRDSGDERFTGVRALGLPLRRRSLAQVSMNLTKPDLVAPDAIIDWIAQRESVVSSELIGVIREADTNRATQLPIQPSQIVRADI